MKYKVTEEMRTRLENTFTYHPVLEGQPERYVAIRDKCAELAELLCGSCPPSRELSLALTKLEEVSMHANASIARHELPDSVGT